MASPEVTRWRAVPGVLVAVPGQQCTQGMRARYVGRAFSLEAQAAGEKDLEKVNPATDADENCAFARADGIAVQSELLRLAKQGDITPGDKTTAEWCGVPIASAEEPITTPDPPVPPVTTRRVRATEDR